MCTPVKFFFLLSSVYLNCKLHMKKIYMKTRMYLQVHAKDSARNNTVLDTLCRSRHAQRMISRRQLQSVALLMSFTFRIQLGVYTF